VLPEKLRETCSAKSDYCITFPSIRYLLPSTGPGRTRQDQDRASDARPYGAPRKLDRCSPSAWSYFGLNMLIRKMPPPSRMRLARGIRSAGSTCAKLSLPSPNSITSRAKPPASVAVVCFSSINQKRFLSRSFSSGFAPAAAKGYCLGSGWWFGWGFCSPFFSLLQGVAGNQVESENPQKTQQKRA
jgi:hypothetical protein